MAIIVKKMNLNKRCIETNFTLYLYITLPMMNLNKRCIETIHR